MCEKIQLVEWLKMSFACLGYAYHLQCNIPYFTGLTFPYGTTTNKTECVLMDGVAKWSFLQACYFGNYS